MYRLMWLPIIGFGMLVAGSAVAQGLWALWVVLHAG